MKVVKKCIPRIHDSSPSLRGNKEEKERSCPTEREMAYYEQRGIGEREREVFSARALAISLRSMT